MEPILHLATEQTLFENGRLLFAPMKTKDIVAVEGSVLGGANMLPKASDVIPSLAAALFDAGTIKKKKAAFREALALRGITLSFAAGGDRTYFSGQCFPEDMSFLLSTIAECLGQAVFPEAELKTTKTHAQGALAEQKTDTHALAARALNRMLYDATHPNFPRTIRENELSVTKARRTDLKSFQKMIGRSGLVLALSGDIDATSLPGVVAKAFKKLSEGTSTASKKELNTKISRGEEVRIPIRDKANIDVLLGASLPLTKKHELFHPALLLTDMLGGGFAAHLMQTVRERDGLTYRTYARLGGLSDGSDGYFEAYASFTPSRYEESVAKLRTEIKNFFTTGITEDALARKKDEVAGSYAVGLSTTRGLASALHSLAVDGRDLSYLTEYPTVIRAVPLAEVHSAADLIPFSKLSLAAAGTFQ